jgi:hypothetical protein
LSTANELKLELHEKSTDSFNTSLLNTLNLLYIIDVSEDEIKKLDGSDLVIPAEQVAFLILKENGKSMV